MEGTGEDLDLSACHGAWQGLRRHLSVLKKESNEARKKKMDGKKGLALGEIMRNLAYKCL